LRRKKVDVASAKFLAGFRRKPCRKYGAPWGRETNEVWILEPRIPATRGVATAPNVGCVISEEWVDRAVVIRVAGVLDMLTSPQLEVAVAASLLKMPSAIIVDLTDVDFLASAGMGVLVAARDQAASTAKFGVVADGPATSRPLTMVGLADLLGLHRTLDEARAALGE